MNSVRLYNRYTQGRVTPVAANWNAAQNKATAPSVLGSKTAAALTYTVPSPFVQYLDEIYTFEALAGVAFSPTANNNTCLVIGGKYGTDANETFYRVDFVNASEATPSYLPLLRNHSYKVNIKEISASGYATPAAAFAARPINIKAGIVVWDDAKITKMAYDDQYILGVSDDDLTFTREVCTITNTDNTLSVTTEVPGGWKVDKIVDSSGSNVNSATNPTTGWLSLSPTTGAANTTTDSKVLLKENTTGSPRVGYIHLVAGTLTYIVKVTQTTDIAMMLSITNVSNEPITDLVFAAASGAQPPAQTIRLSWMPVTQAVSVSTTAFGGSGFAYATGGTLTTPGTGSGTSYSHASGTLPLDIRPTAFTPSATNPFEERISKVDFTVNNGMSYLSKSVFFRQMVYALVVDQTTSLYPLDGSTYTLNVRSNANWKIKSVTPVVTSGSGSLLNLSPTDNLRTTTTGCVNTNPGTPVTFRVTNNTVDLRGILTIVFESTDSPKRFNDVSVTLNLTGEYYPPMHNGWAGSNIYWDTTRNRLTFDDVGVTTHQNYQGLFFQWGSLWGIDPSGTHGSVWTNRVYKLSSGSYSYTTSAWNSIPHVSHGDDITSNPVHPKTERDRAYLYEITDPATGIGDICKYMTDMGLTPGDTSTKWRMPTSQECETAASYTRSGNWTIVNSDNQAGLFVNSNAPGWTKSDAGTPFFPAAGSRPYGSGSMMNLGARGTYWSGSPCNIYGYVLEFQTSYPNILIGGSPRANGFSVRCVKE